MLSATELNDQLDQLSCGGGCIESGREKEQKRTTTYENKIVRIGKNIYYVSKLVFPYVVN